MNSPSKRATIYFEPALHQALRLKAANTHRSISELVNDALRESLREDQEDLAALIFASSASPGVILGEAG